MAGSDIPNQGVLLPISLRGKLMGIIYADHKGEQPWDIGSAQALTAVACLLIDTLPNRSESPSPILAEIAPVAAEEPGPAVDFEQALQIEPPGAASVEPEIVAPVEAPQRQQDAPVEPPVVQHADEPEIVETADYDFEPEPAVEDFDPSATMRVEVAENISAENFDAAAAAEQPAPAAGTEAASVVPPSVDDMEAPPPVRPIEPPPAEPAAAPAGAMSADDEAKHEEARRFARLLVSETKLYNEDEVNRGRSEKDIGVRLKDDIERSREMFEKRISAEIRTGNDYFQEELIRILADGDADALGV